MDENLIPNFDDDKIAKVRGNLFNRLIQAILNNRWSTGWGLISEKGVNGGLISLDPNVIPGPDPIPYWRGKVTVSGSSSADHTIREVDANGDVIAESDGGRKTESGRAYNGRKGVPVDTLVNVFEHPPASSDDYADYKFLIPDGLTTSPDTDLTLTAVGAGDSNWDVEDQGGKDGVEYDPARVALDATTMWHYNRKTILDSSGFVIEVGAEEVDTGGGPADFSREWYITADAQDVPKDDHITLVTTANGNANGKDVKLNQPQASLWDLVFKSTDGTVTFDGGGSTAEVQFDNSGRALLAKGGADLEIDLSAPGAGGNDGQGYEFVDHNDVEVGAETDNGRINFKDNGTTPTLPEVEVAWTITDDDANDTVDVEGKVDCTGVYTFTDGTTATTNLGVDFTDDGANGVTAVVDFSDISGYVASPTVKQVLVNDNGTIKWVDTAECP